MKTLNIGILEDNPFILKDLINSIKEFELANIKLIAQNTREFLNKFNQTTGIDAVVLDIDIDGDSMNGIDVANHLKLPILFITGKTKEYLNEIEDLRLYHQQPVEFLTKPIREEKLKLVFEKFKQQITANRKANTIELKFVDGFRKEFQQDDIVYIESDTDNKSNDKLIYLKSESEPQKISKISMDQLFEKGLSKENFTQTHQSFIINNDYFKDYENGQTEHSFSFMANGIQKTGVISISKNYKHKKK